MNEHDLTTQHQQELIVDLIERAQRRSADRAASGQRATQRQLEISRRHERAVSTAASQFESRHAELIAQYKQAREAAFAGCESEAATLQQEDERFTAAETQRHAEAIEAARNLREHRCRELERAFREQQDGPRQELAQFRQQCEQSSGELSALVVKTQSIVRGRCPWPDEPPAIELPAGRTPQDYLQQFSAALSSAFARLYELQNHWAARFVEDGWPLLIFLFLSPALGLGVWLSIGGWGWGWVAGISRVAALTIAWGARAAIWPLASRATRRLTPAFQAATGEARSALAAAQGAARALAESRLRELAEWRDRELADAKAEYKRFKREEKTKHGERLSAAATALAARLTAIDDQCDRRLDEVERDFPRQIEAQEQALRQTLSSLAQRTRQELNASRQEQSRDLAELDADWRQRLAAAHSAAQSMLALCDTICPAWDRLTADAAPAASVRALRFGQWRVKLAEATDEDGAPASNEPGDSNTELALPAVLSYPDRPSLILEASDAGREAAIGVMHSVMLRWLTAFPPGKVRFTIIDPVGLGQNFSAFMHLADYDERLVTNRIWTEPAHIHQRLADLTEHMENVIQKYLRNEFASIQEYNEHAGEVAEPLHILVVANFPANFSEEAARRLASIAASGPRCGVFLLLSSDVRREPPRGFDPADLARHAQTLVWHSELAKFRWKDESLSQWPLAVDAPPGDDIATAVIRRVGLAAKHAARVEVPFDFVIPPEGRCWTADSRGGIELPLGRAGAKNLQYLRLGKGTSQHVLISGKTGSGKSTLLNGIITNLALHYSPDELEFYLIDFKKGVEFKAYATAQLPHARVIAIESEREFGMSVLERLDLELKRRGDLFRQHHVQDLASYRNAASGAVLPRVLLIIDEFQEFFTSDDRIAHDAALLLDRLVRQGRAFGIHVLLGSQTLAGAYSLARSTIGQMAVRIALQCSDADAHLILSEDNTAARLLGRPGEAIYNDANGLVEGNHPFQVVWLSDGERARQLERVRKLAVARQIAVAPPIVFEGSAAADPGENHLLRETLAAPAPTKTILAPRAWLGAAVAVKDPTAITFLRQGGSNLLIVGQQEELAIGVLATAVVSLAGQTRHASAAATGLAPSSIRATGFVVLDGARADSPEVGYWSRLNDKLALGAFVAAPRDAAQAIAHVASELDRRMASGQHQAEPMFLIVHNLARFRDLRKSDDFAASVGDDAPPDLARQLATILREGPPVGIHALVWCDSFTSASRWLERQTLRDFDLRLLFQMSATDSSNLMDSPAASRLGGHMALLYSEDLGQAEKLRPYALPADGWLTWAAERLAERASPSQLPLASAP